ncbi:MAG: site-2 protease family protein [Dehalococcoidia bacterium]|nr:site-2 protease family protein [Dehalococcoidia bacterium]
MRHSIGLGRIFGIPLRLHYTWFIIFVLLTISLVVYFPGDYPLEQRILSGILTSGLFFASIVAHELAHSALAIHNHIAVKDITLFVFGGVSQITREATHPRTEFLIAVVGPLASLALGGIFYGVHLLLAAHPLLAAFMLWLAIINVILAVFNLVPGFPLDGGRMLRAIVWQRTNNYQKATSIATKVGRGIAYAFIAVGIVIALAYHSWLNGLWLVFIGWFLHDAARASYQQALLREYLSGITVRHVMDHGCPLVARDFSLRDLAQQYILPTGRTCFPVTREAELEGMITLQQIGKISKAKWDSTLVQDVMTPASKLKTTYPDQDILALLQEMNNEIANHMPVIERGKVIGVLNREDLNRFLRTRTSLGMMRLVN